MDNTAKEVKTVFIVLGYKETDLIEFRPLYHFEDENGEIETEMDWKNFHTWTPKEFIENIPLLKELNTKKEKPDHIFFGVNTRTKIGGRKNEDVKICRCFFSDFDNLPENTLECVEKRIKAANIPQPTILIQSGHGFHAYWVLVKAIKPERWSTPQSNLVDAVGGDKKTKDLARILRLPGFNNTKYKKVVPCSIVKINEANIYDDNFISLLENLKIKEAAAEKRKENWSQYDLNFQALKFYKIFEKEEINFNEENASKDHVLLHCIFPEEHDGGVDEHPSFSLALKDGKNYEAGTGKCFAHPTEKKYSILDVILFHRDNKYFEKKRGIQWKRKTALIKELADKYPGFYTAREKDYKKLHQRLEDNQSICWDYDLDRLYNIVNDFVNTIFFETTLRYIEWSKTRKGYWEFYPKENKWEELTEKQIDGKFRYYLKDCTILGGSKPFPQRWGIIRDLLKYLEVFNGVYYKAPENVFSFWFNEIENSPEAELLLPFKNGNLFMNLEAPYGRSLLAVMDNHFHLAVHKFDYNSKTRHKLLEKALKIAFVNDDNGKKVYLEFGGSVLAGWNIEKIIAVMAPAVDSSKTLLMGLLEYAMLEANCFPSEIGKVSNTFTTSDWIGHRLITFPEAWNVDNKAMKAFLSKLAAYSGDDRTASEGKFEKQLGGRPEFHFLVQANEIIAPDDSTGKWIRRLLYIPREESIPKEKQIKGLFKKLREDDTAIMALINLFLAADKERRERGLVWSVSKDQPDQQTEMQEMSNPLLSAIVDLIQAGGEENYLEVNKVFRVMGGWHRLRKNKFDYNEATFGRAFRSAIIEKLKIELPKRCPRKGKNKVTVYPGIKWTEYGEFIQGQTQVIEF